MLDFQPITLFHGAAQPVLALQSVITIQLSGLLLLLFFIVLGAYIGWVRGIRAILTVAIVSVIAYILCVRGGNSIVDTVNRFYQNGPRLFAFAVGRDPEAAPVLDPLINPGFTIPLFFRFVLFIALIAFAWFFNKRPKWYAAQPNTKNEPLSQALGAFVGGFTALVMVSAFTSFWVELLNNGGGFGGPIAAILLALPDVAIYIPAMITIFVILLVVIILFNLPKLWKA